MNLRTVSKLGLLKWRGDVLSLGCVFYVFLTEGTHPFGEGFSNPVNTRAKAINLTSCSLSAMKTPRIYDNITELQESASMLGLVSKMIKNNAVERPTMAQVAEELESKWNGNLSEKAQLECAQTLYNFLRRACKNYVNVHIVSTSLIMTVSSIRNKFNLNWINLRLS